MDLIKCTFFVTIVTLYPLFLCAQADVPKKDTANIARDISGIKDSSRTVSPFKPYIDFVNAKTSTSKGLFTIHKTEEKWFVEINDSVIGRDILVVTRLSKAGADMRNQILGYAGDEVNESVIRFDKGPDNKIFLRKISYTEYSKDSTKSLYQAVMNSNIQPIAAAFDVKSFNPMTKAMLLDWTEWLNGDNDILFFDPKAKTTLQLGLYQPDKAYVSKVNSYPLNLEIRAVKTYVRAAPPMAAAPAAGTSTLEINTSIVMLPQKPMRPRYADKRIGYLTVGYTDFDKNEQGIQKISMIKRWRLEPKLVDIEKYRRGELVEPLKPIVFYIDPATPKKWVPYLILGVNDWQQTFEKAGFKNAIVAKRAPTKAEDSTWSIEDARYSAIVYKPSAVPNASGPSVADPRSGEVLESHVNWYHNVMSLLHKWYFIQAGAIDPGARKLQLEDSLMGQLIRFVSSHEIGHTLGLLHNFGSSSTVPVEKLRDKKWLEINGHTPSIMDYARFNYVAQPEDHISEKGIFPRIGDYDNWAIEWGYKILADTTDEATTLNKLTIEKLKNKRLWFGQESNADDPRSQNDDLGDDAVKAGTYGIKNLKRIVPKLKEWMIEPTEDYGHLQEMYNEAVSQFMRYMGHAVKSIGGIYETQKTMSQPGNVYEYVSAVKQRAALQFISEQLFSTPSWLLNKDIYFKFGSDPVGYIGIRQEMILDILLNTANMDKLINGQAVLGQKAYSLAEFTGDLQSDIWKELETKTSIDVYRRNLQKLYIEKMGKFLHPLPDLPTAIVVEQTGNIPIANDIISIVKFQLKKLETKIQSTSSNNLMTNIHLQYCADRLAVLLNPKM
jgi:hypothetical protein